MTLLTLYVFGSCFQMLAVILVSDLEVGGGGGSLISQSRLDAGCGCVSCQLAPGTATVTGLVESVTSAAVNVSLCFHLFVWLNLIVSLSHTNCIMHTKSNKCHSLTSELED